MQKIFCKAKAKIIRSAPVKETPGELLISLTADIAIHAADLPHLGIEL